MEQKTTTNTESRQIASANLTAVDLFCGCGGMSLGFQNAGFSIAAAYDFDEYALSIYRDNFAHPAYQWDINYESIIDHIRQHNPFIIFGGPPCQDFSGAGKRIIGERAALTSRFAEIVAVIKPQWFVMENVAAIKTTGAEILAQAKQVLKAAGYGLTERVLNASHCGVPQNRKRYFLIGCLGEKDDFIGDRIDAGLAEKPMTVRDYLGDSFDTEYFYMTPRNTTRRGVYSIDEPCCTLRGVNSPIPPSYKMRKGDMADVASGNVRVLSVKERGLMQTFPEDFRWGSVSPTRGDKAAGNAVPVKMGEYIAKRILEHISDNPALSEHICAEMFTGEHFRKINNKQHDNERRNEMEKITVQYVSIDAISVACNNIRTGINEESLDDLAISIKGNGILHPIRIWQLQGNGDCYEVETGERRLRAARLAGLETVPAIIVGETTPEVLLERRLAENMAREDLCPFDKSVALNKYKQSNKNTKNEMLANRIGMTRTRFEQALKLAELPKEFHPYFRNFNEDGKTLSMSHGEVLHGLRDKYGSASEDVRKSVLEIVSTAHKEGTARDTFKRQLEKALKLAKDKVEEEVSENVQGVTNILDDLFDYYCFGVSVTAKEKNGKATIRITYDVEQSADVLDGITYAYGDMIETKDRYAGEDEDESEDE